MAARAGRVSAVDSIFIFLRLVLGGAAGADLRLDVFSSQQVSVRPKVVYRQFARCFARLRALTAERLSIATQCAELVPDLPLPLPRDLYSPRLASTAAWLHVVVAVMQAMIAANIALLRWNAFPII